MAESQPGWNASMMEGQTIAETGGWVSSSMTCNLVSQIQIFDGNPAGPVALMKPKSKAVVKKPLVGEKKLLETQQTLSSIFCWM